MPSLPTLQIISNTLKKEIGYFFKNEEKNGFIITDPNDRRIVISRSGPHGKTTYELELLAEGMKNPFMEPAIVTHVGKGGEVEEMTHDGQEFILKKGNAAYWNGNVPHKGIGMGRKLAKALHVHLIPGRWTGTFQHEDLPDQSSKVRMKKREHHKDP